MSADFWSGYLAGAAGILIGNPLDLLKTRLQATSRPTTTTTPSTPTGSPASSRPSTPTLPSEQTLHQTFARTSTLARGAAFPILGYGALNALLYVTYNRALTLLGDSPTSPSSLSKIYVSGAAGGFATFLISAPTELIKCRAQVSQRLNQSSLSIAREIFARDGVRGLYMGGGVTSVRDAVGYGWYFWSYEVSKRVLDSQGWLGGENGANGHQTALKVLLSGGIAGVVTWTSVYPLDVVKTRVQTQVLEAQDRPVGERDALLGRQETRLKTARRGTLAIARQAYREEGVAMFFRGLGICSVRAFIVNAVQWAVYEWMMALMRA